MQVQEFAIAALQARLRKMDDAALKRFGEAAAYMCTPEANPNSEPRLEFVIQREEARAEWRRRHPGP